MQNSLRIDPLIEYIKVHHDGKLTQLIDSLDDAIKVCSIHTCPETHQDEWEVKNSIITLFQMRDVFKKVLKENQALLHEM